MTQDEFIELYLKNEEYFMRVAVKRCECEDLAKDVLQSSLLKAIENLDKYTSVSKFRNWFNTIIRNTHLDCLRKAKVRKTAPLETWYSEEYIDNIDSQLNEESLLIEFRKHIGDVRCEIIKYVTEGYTKKEIAAKMGLSESEVYWVIQRLKQTVKDSDRLNKLLRGE